MTAVGSHAKTQRRKAGRRETDGVLGVQRGRVLNFESLRPSFKGCPNLTKIQNSRHDPNRPPNRLDRSKLDLDRRGQLVGAEADLQGGLFLFLLIQLELDGQLFGDLTGLLPM